MIRTILHEVKEYKKASIATPLFMILEVLMEMMIPFLMASIIDDGVNAGDIGHIYKVGGVMVIAASIGLLAGMAGTAPRQAPGLQRTCGRPCSTTSRHFHLQILTSTVPQGW